MPFIVLIYSLLCVPLTSETDFSVVKSRGVYEKILVGAPKDKNYALPEISRPGLLYRCSYSTHQCLPVTVNNAGNKEESITYHNKRVNFYNDMNDQWLGMTLDVEPSNHSSVIVCAPRWRDTYLEKKMRGISHMNGICYLLTPDLRTQPKYLPALTNLKRLINRKNYVEFSMGAMGLSATFSKKHDTLLFGAPGLNDWSGGVVVESISGENNVQYIEPSRHKYQDSFSGYAITTGRFINRNKYSVATGAPRAGNIGQVLVYSSESTIGPRLTVEGTQTGSYFGAALCAVSIETKQLDYLIVGAPLFTENGPEEGQVFIYKSHGMLGFRKAGVIKGLQKPYGRFGTSVANIGDLNKDGYEDICVGSPYEDEGRGAVYIYNGYRSGIWRQFTQYIKARNLYPGIQTLGISFSRPYDVDKNGYLDIVVGAYKSDNAILLHAIPVIDMSKTTLAVSNITKMDGCIINGQIDNNCTHYNLVYGHVKFCMSYKGHGQNVPVSIVTKYQLLFDTSRNKSRVYFNNSNTLSPGRSLTAKHTIQVNRPACNNGSFYIQYTDETDDDVWVDFEYNIMGKDVQLQQFDGTKIHPELSNKRRTKIILKPKCEDGDMCGNNIVIDAAIDTSETNSTSYILGKSKNTRIDVNISNIKTTKDLTVKIRYSNYLSFVKSKHILNNVRLPCDVDDIDDIDMSVSCRVNGDILYNTTDNVTISFEFYVRNVDVSDSVQFIAYAYSRSRTSNNVTVNLSVISWSNVTVFGKSTPDEVINISRNNTVIGEERIKFSYIVYNTGPSALRSGHIYISYPELPGVLDMNGLEIVTDHRDTSQYYCTLKRRGEINSDLVDKFEDSGNVALVCSDRYSYCTCIVCELKNLQVKTTVRVNIHLLLTTKHSAFKRLRHIKFGSVSIFKNTSDEEQWDQVILYSNAGDKSQILLDMYNVNMNYQGRDMQIWIVMVSGAGGVAFFLMISLFMFKSGFFRRLENEDLMLKKANWKLQIADARRLRGRTSITHRLRHSINNAVFTSEMDDDETNVLIPFSNGSSTMSLEDDGFSISSGESGYLEPIKTRKQRVYLK